MSDKTPTPAPALAAVPSPSDAASGPTAYPDLCCPDPLQEPAEWQIMAGLWVKQTACMLCDDPRAVTVQTVGGAQAVIFELKVEPEDVKRVIGRRGRTADALRELLLNMGARVGRRYILEIVEPHTPPGADLVGADTRRRAESVAGVPVHRMSGGRLAAERTRF